MGYPLVSVIIATYNWKEKRFIQTLDSILNQSYKNIELIIINDCSTNNIEEVILKYCKKYKNIVYLKNEKNLERSYSRNRWIFESRWKYIAFCDDDDIWSDKDKIRKQVEYLERNKDCVLCWTSVIEIDGEKKQIKKLFYKSWDKKIKDSLLQSNQFAFSSVMIKKDILFFSWLFNFKYNKAEDYDLWLRIWRYWKLDNISDIFIQYRTWQWNTTTSSKFWIKKNAFIFMLKNRNYYPNFLKALILRFWDFIIPETMREWLLKKFKF